MTYKLEPSDRVLLEHEVVRLLHNFVNQLKASGHATPRTAEAWHEYGDAGLKLWATIEDSRIFQEYRDVPRLVPGGVISSVDEAKAKEWDAAWIEWLWQGYGLAETYPETRGNDLLCQTICRLAQELLNPIDKVIFNYGEILEVVQLLSPSSSLVKEQHARRIAELQKTADNGAA